MVAAHRNPALAVLDGQLKKAHPGMEIGWIADAAHKPPSDHIPDPDGTVDALDPMIGPHYTANDALLDVRSLVSSRDKRIAFIIWDRRIVSSTIEPWTWRKYAGTDPHTGHWHISTLDKNENSTVEWKIYVAMAAHPIPTFEISGTKPFLRQGMTDAQMPGGVAHIRRMQLLLGITDDGFFGPQTNDALKKYLGSTYNGVVDMDDWRKILGLW